MVLLRFNTVNGKYCCNLQNHAKHSTRKRSSFNTASGKYCYNALQKLMTIIWLNVCFNTVNGKYCYIITFVFPSFQSGTRDVRASSSLCFSAASHPSSHTVNGKYCRNTEPTTNNVAAIMFQYRKRSKQAPIRFIIPTNLGKYW